MLSVLKSQVEVMKTSTKRLTTQTEQHGCVQQVGFVRIVSFIFPSLDKAFVAAISY